MLTNASKCVFIGLERKQMQFMWCRVFLQVPNNDKFIKRFFCRLVWRMSAMGPRAGERTCMWIALYKQFDRPSSYCSLLSLFSFSFTFPISLVHYISLVLFYLSFNVGTFPLAFLPSLLTAVSPVQSLMFRQQFESYAIYRLNQQNNKLASIRVDDQALACVNL